MRDAFAQVPLLGTTQEVAAACAAAVARLLGGPARLVIPLQPVPVEAGDAAADLSLLLRLPVFGGHAELHASRAPTELPPAVAAELGAQLLRIWRVQEELAARALEQDRLRFNLTALQQTARTLAVVRRTDQTERLALDSIGEVFFAWWAALYRSDGNEYVCRAVRSLRGETVPDVLSAAVVNALGRAGGEPLVPPSDAAIRRAVAAEIALIEFLELDDGGAGLLLLGPRMTEAPYDRHDLALLRALADSSAIALRNAGLLDRLRAQATVDPLTGCRNRRGFDELLAVELARAQRHGRSLALVLVDIDHFKRINDDLGHDAGDHALRRLGKALKSAFRVSDAVCRYGGEEFAIVFPETGKDDAMRLGERLRALIEALEPDEVLPRRLTASLGVAAFPDDAPDAAELFRAADRALYLAKTGGRNRVAAV